MIQAESKLWVLHLSVALLFPKIFASSALTKRNLKNKMFLFSVGWMWVVAISSCSSDQPMLGMRSQIDQDCRLQKEIKIWSWANHVFVASATLCYDTASALYSDHSMGQRSLGGVAWQALAYSGTSQIPCIDSSVSSYSLLEVLWK